MPPKFIYFDLGNVVVHFSDERACRQMSQVSGVPPERIVEVLFGGGMKKRLECGELTSEGFYEEFCRVTGTQPDAAALERAGSDIFQLNQTIIPVIAQLENAGYPIGLLSNISEPHWRFVRGLNYGILPRSFRAIALSYELGCVKPDPRIYREAARLAGFAPQDIFFTDDIAGHVESARQAGFDAVQYTSTPALVVELHKRGVRFNY